MTFIKGLGDVQRSDIASAGGKAVGLGGLIQAGLPVPPGFVLTTDAYSAFVSENEKVPFAFMFLFVAVPLPPGCTHTAVW